jgi:hypothetical protein
LENLRGTPVEKTGGAVPELFINVVKKEKIIAVSTVFIRKSAWGGGGTI